LLVFLTVLCAGTAVAQSPQVRSENAPETRDELIQLLQQYPPSLAEVLRLDHSLLTNREFLGPYTRLTAFIAQHPEILRNPAYFVGERTLYQPSRNSNDPARVAAEIMTPMAVTLVLGSLMAAVAWIVKSVIDYRRWLRMSKVQTEVHSKLLDRFTASDDLLAYIQTPAGKKFLESSPISLDSGSRFSAPVGRILLSVQVGLVLGFAGLGILYASNNFESEVARPFFVLGVLGIALSIGFVLSALASYLISRSLGLISPPPTRETTSPPS
jgi:hypothetical protein